MSSHCNTVRLDRVLWPVHSLGWGSRAVIWFQGCSIGCEGCCATHTWSDEHGSLRSIESIIEWLAEISISGVVDGITISGGEPFEQPDALEKLLHALRQHICLYEGGRDILVYSGYSWGKLQRNFPLSLRMIDTVVSGRYVYSLPGAPLRGSSNQIIHRLTNISLSRYSDDKIDDKQTLDYYLTDGKLQLIGIPDRGDLHRISSILHDFGIELDFDEVPPEIDC